MDIDVKNALKKLLIRCDDKAKKYLMKDIKQFIKYISHDNAEERIDLFCKVYWPENIDIEEDPDEGAITVDAIEYFFETKEYVQEEVLDFFVVLGKTYIFSKFDKKDINREKYVEYLKAIKLLLDKQETKEDRVLEELDLSINSNTKITDRSAKDECEILQVQRDEIEAEESLENLMKQLRSLIGLETVKQEVEQIVNLVSIQKKAEEFGESPIPFSLHLVFYGNPGTGKTTVARLLARIYKSLGVLTIGQLVEVDRGGLVSGYVGQTAIKTQEVIDKAMGGVLFIDEAYTLTHGKGENDFGQEAVDTLLKAMEDKRNEFVVIVAGYPDLMKEFIASNPGLKSRFNQYIYFEDYEPEQLFEIFNLQCSKHNLVLDKDGKEYVLNYFTNLYLNRNEDYANGRDVRNYFEQVYRMHANRLMPIIDSITKEEYLAITISDLEKAALERRSQW